jgi:N6-adenosine-specific RNA methylase IME4
MTQPELTTGRDLEIFRDYSDAPVPSGWAESVVLSWCNEQKNLNDLDDARDNLETAIHHLRKKRLDFLELQKAQRYVEMRIGELLPPYSKTDKKSHSKLPSVQADYEYRRLHLYRDDCKQWIGEGVTARSALLKRIEEKEASNLTGEALFELPATYQVIYADPPWRYDHTETPDVRQIENQYTTMTMDDLKKLTIPAGPDAVMFMWATNPKLKEALELMEAWGFSYRTNAVWVKDRIGMGYYFRGAHELLLIGRKGNLSLPPTSSRPRSWVEAPRQAHSVKPDKFFEHIEAMYPDCSKLEMFARAKRPGWTAWGHGVSMDAEIVEDS